MRKQDLTILDDMALAQLKNEPKTSTSAPPPTHWIRMLRNYLRMSQAELAERAHIPQSHIAGIESGKFDPQIDTLKRIYESLYCDLIVKPNPRKPLDEVLRGRARSIALKRLKRAMGTMALENQAPDRDVFLQLLEKRTDEILNDRRERLWSKKDE